MPAVQPVPVGYATVTPYLILPRLAAFLDFVKRAFGATVTVQMEGAPGEIVHAEIKIGDSVMMMGAAREGIAVATGSYYVYGPDVDEAHARAVREGATSTTEPKDQFYGDRSSCVTDAWGNIWYLATHTEDVTPEQMKERMAKQFGG
jgi:PhnB protein